MSDDLTTLSMPSKEVQDHFARLLLATPIRVLDKGEIKTYYLFEHEIEDLKKNFKEKLGKI